MPRRVFGARPKSGRPMSSTTLTKPPRRAVPTPRIAKPVPHRPGHAPRRSIGDAFVTLGGIGLVAIIATVVHGETRGALAAAGGKFIAGGRLGGFVGAYLMLVMVVLIARIPWLERAIGQDRLVGWHRRIAPWAIGLITAHVVLITLGYAESAHTGVLRELWTFVTSYPDVLAAMAAFALIIMAGVTSIRIARRRMRYETWWIVHLYTYLALTLAFAHQIATGGSFVGHPLAKAIWATVWGAAAGAVLFWRVLHPIARSIRHQLRVVTVVEEAPGVTSIIVKGRRLDRLAVSGGQFFRWRFLTRDLRWHAHPYSLSALPQPPLMRLTVKANGEHSAQLASLKPGTRVMIEGPYGAFTRHARTQERVALIAAGVGVTPLRALLEDLPSNVDVVAVLRGSTAADLVHRDEMAALVAERNGRLFEIIGPRSEVRLDASALGKMIPDINRRDVYVCGPSGFTDEILKYSHRLRVPPNQIHREAFEF